MGGVGGLVDFCWHCELQCSTLQSDGYFERSQSLAKFSIDFECLIRFEIIIFEMHSNIDKISRYDEVV